MHLAKRLVAPFLTVALLGGILSPVQAATYQFDLSALLDSEGNLPQGLAVDLGTKFSQIENATLTFEAVFTPGSVTLNPMGPPLVPSDPPLEIVGPDLPEGTSAGMVMVAASMGDEATPNLASPAQGWWQSDGGSGSVQGELLLRAPGMQTLVPADDPANLGFLLDGEFQLSMLQFDLVPFAGEVVVDPSFKLTGLMLQINGTAVPEPASAGLIVVACGLAVAWRRVRAG